MGTNYYLVKKANYDKETKLSKLKKDTVNDELYKSIITKIVKQKSIYKDILNIYEQSSDVIEKLEDNINDFVNDTKYKFESIFDIYDWEKNKIHIGKNSYGWLFHFQTSKFWKSYKEFRQHINNMSEEWIIINEYDEILTTNEMLEIIDSVQSKEENKDNLDNFTNARNVDGYRFSDYNFS